MNDWRLALHLRPILGGLLHAVLAAVAFGALFAAQPRLTLGQFDGAYAYVSFDTLFRWQPPDDPFSAYMPHAGLGGRISSIPFPLLPHLWPFWLTDDPVTRVWTMYVVLAGLLAASSLAYFRAAGLTTGTARAASWLYLVVMLTLPDLGRANPNTLHAQAGLLAALALFAVAGRRPPVQNGLAVAAFALMVTATLLANLNFAAYVMTPIGMVAAGAHLLAVRRPAERWWKLGALLLAGGIVVALDIPRWAALLGASTSRLVFFQELIAQPQYAHNAGLLFRPLDAFTVLYALAIFGIVRELMQARGERRILAGLGLVLGVGVGVAGLIWLLTDYQWRGPAPAYLNVACYPWLVLAAVRGVERAGRWGCETDVALRGSERRAGLLASACVLLFLAGRAALDAASGWAVGAVAVTLGAATVAPSLAARLAGRSRGSLPSPTAARWWVLGFALLLVLFSGDILNVSTLRNGQWGQPNGAQRLAASRPPFAEILQERVGIWPGGPFRGYADGYAEMPRTLVLTPPELMEWQLRDIPTLSQYSLNLTPAYHLFITRLLAHPNDRPNVNHLTATRLDTRLLQLLGLRLLVSSVPLADPALTEIGREGDRLLYELAEPNLGTYSPTNSSYAPDAASMLAALGSPAFDPRREFVHTVQGLYTPALTPLTSPELTIQRGGFRFRARADGPSLAVLPIQYTRCLTIESASPAAAPVQVMRVNLILTGIVFRDAVDITGRVRYGGPWEQCLADEFDEIDRLRIRELVERRRLPSYSHPGWRLPLFGPLGLD